MWGLKKWGTSVTDIKKKYLNNIEKREGSCFSELIIGQVERNDGKIIRKWFEEDCKRLRFEVREFKVKIDNSVGSLFFSMQRL